MCRDNTGSLLELGAMNDSNETLSSENGRVPGLD